VRRIGKAEALRLVRDRPGPFVVRHERVACACGTGDGGFRDVYQSDGEDFLAVEYPHARYKVRAYALGRFA
jgi:hypothetical protein